jgi:hypothetical protein
MACSRLSSTFTQFIPHSLPISLVVCRPPNNISKRPEQAKRKREKLNKILQQQQQRRFFLFSTNKRATLIFTRVRTRETLAHTEHMHAARQHENERAERARRGERVYAFPVSQRAAVCERLDTNTCVVGTV